MDYLSILPFDLKNLLQHYINRENWKVASDIINSFLRFHTPIPPHGESYADDTELIASNVKMLSNLKLKFSLSKYPNINRSHLIIPNLEVDELITLQVVKRILNEYIKEVNVKDLWVRINKLLETYNCPVQIIKIKTKCYPNTKCTKYIVVDTEVYTPSVLMDNLVNKMTQA